jgi:hypothetical protein
LFTEPGKVKPEIRRYHSHPKESLRHTHAVPRTRTFWTSINSGITRCAEFERYCGCTCTCRLRLSYKEVGRALKISKNVVAEYALLARAAGVDWNHAQALNDEDLDAWLFRPAAPRSSPHLAPDFARPPRT